MNSNTPQCSACSGAGAISCLTPCSQCSGTGTTSTPVACASCAGSGTHNGRACGSCRSSGRRPIPPDCSTCSGTGSYTSTVPCPTCPQGALRCRPTDSSYVCTPSQLVFKSLTPPAHSSRSTEAKISPAGEVIVSGDISPAGETDHGFTLDM